MGDCRQLPPPTSGGGDYSGDGTQKFHRTGRGTSVFFKTKLCSNFMEGRCVYGGSCCYAHGQEELRPTQIHREEEWSVEQRRPPRQEICKRFIGPSGCNYGERCFFLHEWPEECQKSSAIRVPITAAGFEVNRDGSRQRVWKTRICHKWEFAGQCSYGESCIYAHGQSELRKLRGLRESGNKNAVASPSNPLPNHHIDDLSDKAESNYMHEASRNSYLRMNDPKKIGQIYGDWIDDISQFRCTLPKKADK